MRLVHVSFDLETLGPDRPTAAIAQIGAVAFADVDLEPGGYAEPFEAKLSFDDCLRLGLTVDEGALMFWLFQPEDVRRALSEGRKLALAPALEEFGRWLRAVMRARSFGCGRTPPSTAPILNTARAAAGLERPYPRNCFRDLTTKLKDAWASKAAIRRPPAAGLEHDALHDAILQAGTLKLALAEERRRRPGAPGARGDRGRGASRPPGRLHEGNPPLTCRLFDPEGARTAVEVAGAHGRGFPIFGVTPPGMRPPEGIPLALVALARRCRDRARTGQPGGRR